MKRVRSADLDASAESSSTEEPAEQIRLANVIKAHHRNLQLAIADAPASEGEAVWCQATSEDTEALREYSSAMQQLATKFWDADPSSTRRYDDRLLYIAERLEDYFLGSDGEYPRLYRIPVKQERRSYHAQHGCPLPTDAEAALVADLRLRYPIGQTLRVADVGSCYNPLQGKSLRSSVRLDVTAVDLAPFPGSGVLRCDWTRLEVTAPGSPVCAADGALKSVPLNYFDAVIFCLLLSYMPLKELRLKACIRACDTLKTGGLLVIVSTRTQGSRKGDWILRWIQAIESIGFERVDKHIRFKIVGLSFRKTRAGAITEAEVAELLKQQSSLMDVIADTV